MKISLPRIRAALLALPDRWRLANRRNNSVLDEKYAAAEPPLRSELFSADQMERHGKTLAGIHRLGLGRGPDQLLTRLSENENILLNACNLLKVAVNANRRITPAGEWLLDNFYLIEEQIRTARRHFPKGYSRELPLLDGGISAGLPRVYDIALEAISHGDGRVDPESLNRFVAAYQKVTDLKLGELWAIPIMLRLALIENLRRVGARIAEGMIDRNEASHWADQMIGIAENDPKSLILVTADMARSNPPLVNSFVAELARRLQGHSSALALPLTWIEQRLAESGLTIEQLVQSETQSQAANQVSISNSIGSLRFLSAMDWREFVETMSAVELKLREDPDGIYGRMDFATRDHYRHVIENIAKHSRLSETDIARKAIQLAHHGKLSGNPDSKNSLATQDGRAAHVGFYLIGKGLPQLEQAAEVNFSAGEALRRFDRLGARFPLLLYLGAVAILTTLFTCCLMALATIDQQPVWMSVLIGVAALLGASQLALAITNWLATLLVMPHPLPRMDFSLGIPPQSRTLVVVPTMLTSLQSVETLAEALEIRFLANREANLHFGLLTDFRDAHEESLVEDAPLLALARQRIEALNLKYKHEKKTTPDVGDPGDSHDAFFLFHRSRRWNAEERIWMGYERKRGKLGDLNSLIRFGSKEPFSLIVGETTILREVKYVITLDTDTLLPRDSARAFAGTMAHPLNHALYDEASQRVVDGYGILQPLMAVSLPSTNRSRYAQLCGNEPGIDPYTRTVSDVYQDVFQEGSFIGKGIYDVEAFERSLNNRFPENRILSHDLLEGCYARAGLLSDVQLYEEYPSRYSADVSRRHRWIRGDWQIAAWLLLRVPGPQKKRFNNPLSKLSQWKIFDNLRRSLVPAALATLFILGWVVVPSMLYWTLSVIGIMLLPVVFGSCLELLNKPKDVLVSQHLSSVLHSSARQFMQVALTLACLPYEAMFTLDAIFRTSARMLFTRNRLLEWNPSSEHELTLKSGSKTNGKHAASHHAAMNTGTAELASSWRAMWIAPVMAASVGIYLLAMRPVAFVVAAPILALWFAAPTITWWISRPLVAAPAKLGPEQIIFLQKLARKTWRFFEKFITAEDHWLPPDNYQEHPVAALAHRTSPTNMGLALLANLSAYDFGYISVGKLVQRTGNALQTMQSMARYQGHFYNWYDTLSLQPLSPHYVSSVDSGNLSGHLLTLRSGLLAIADQEIIGPRVFEGLCDAMGNLLDAAESMATAATATLSTSRSMSPHQLSEHITRLRRDIESACDAKPATLAAAQLWLGQLCDAAKLLKNELDTTASDTELGDWTDALVMQCQDAMDELTLLAPWVRLSAASTTGSTINNTISSNSNSSLFMDLPGFNAIHTIPTLRELSRLHETLSSQFDPALNSLTTAADQARLAELRPLIMQASRAASERIEILESLAQQAGKLAEVDYDFLYDPVRHLITVGYNVEQHRLDTGHYDLLASEARLASFVAIAQGKIAQESWFALGRVLTVAGGDAILLSWSGSMFEYLMPLLVMPTYANTLLDQTCYAAVKRQIAYGNQRDVPWGISESGYNTVDAALNYQYRAFGVPGLGLKRGLAEDLVIAPYASALALMVMPEAACQNLQRLTAAGLQGKYGMYEAVDYTTSRLPRGQSSAVIRSYMAHHQGMSLLSLAYLLLDRPMQKRFEADPQFQATMLLLQERIPNATAPHYQAAEFAEIRAASIGPEIPMRVLRNPATSMPEVQLLSNGRYHVMVTHAGGGYSRWKDFAVTRWREDTTRDNWGAFCFIRDIATSEFWSVAHQPTLKRADHYEAIFSEGRAEFRRRDHDYETHTEIVVSPEDDIELRRTRITNRSRTRRVIEITSYAEVVLASPAADALHPAFSNLFVQTEIIADRQAIVCTRRPRAVGEQVPWMFHLMAVHGASVVAVSYETDRMRFIGRTRSIDSPEAMMAAGDEDNSGGNNSGLLSGSQGSVLDPIVAIRYRITLDADQTVTIDMVSGIGETRDAVLNLIGKYRDRNLADRVFDLAWTHSWVNLRQINATESDAQIYSRLASSVIYANPLMRAEPNVLARNRRGQSALWGYAISGDLPIVLLQISDLANIELVRQLVQAHAYWRLKGLAVDLVIWNEDHAGYRQLLQEQIMGLITAGLEANQTDRPGGIFVRAAEQISSEDRILFQTVARVIISDSRGTLNEQISRRSAKENKNNKDKREAPLLRMVPGRSAFAQRSHTEAVSDRWASSRNLLFFNGLGGFSPDGREYLITTAIGQTTPAPWVNVIANAQFGTVLSESGAAYTWSENAHEFRFTPWGDDPVTDSSGEAIYIRDEDSGYFYSPTSLPCPGSTPYLTRHGFGYSVFEHDEEGIHTELTIFVDPEAAVKFSVLKIRNQSGRSRRLSATGYVEWVLGDLRAKSAMHIVTEIDAASGALCARNPYSMEFADRVVFFDVDDATNTANVTVSGDREEFLGRNGTLGNPAAMNRAKLSNKVGAGMDPCGAIQVMVELADSEERQIIFRLGAAGRRGIDDSSEIIQRLRGTEAVRKSLDTVHQYWADTLGTVQVETPDSSLNLLANGWLLYQTLACRVWARSGYYQSGGAFGFRDQLQDTMALVHADSRLLRDHLLRCATRQFPEGDVQHWWHPPVGRGVRTHCSDDFLWLPQATCRYVLSTGDTLVLNESINFIDGRPVNPEDDSYYDLPTRSETRATLYQHCVQAILRGLRFGEHGLPLMGSGDWNDGMNLVGIQGKGESVWLGFFLYDTLIRFKALALLHGDAVFADRCEAEAVQLRRNLEQHGWDGEWYRRAYFDDGSPLGSALNSECQIDSISQSWAVLSGAGETARAQTAMNAMDKRLVKRDHALVQLLDPPFDKSLMNPGYIKGYVPGVRENGGQYTHAAIWAAMAFAAMDDKPRAWEIFNMINPVNHGKSPDTIATYKVEPYVVAADVYAVSPHVGRGGWTWYTGSAGWMYRLILESLLGLRIEADKLWLAPCLPSDWQGFTLRYRYRETPYMIKVLQLSGTHKDINISVDGIAQSVAIITLVDDHQEHAVEIRIQTAQK